MIKRYIVDENCLVKEYLIKQNIFASTQKEIKNGNGQILVNDQPVENWYQLKKDDLLEVVFPVSTQGDNIASIMHDFEILYEDSYLLIVNKENNLASIPTREHFNQSISNYIMSYYKRKGIVANIHCVGRLDYATSGIMIFAKSPYIMALLKKQNIIKKYILEVEGLIKDKTGTIETGIIKDPNSIIKRMNTYDFINSKTSYEVLRYNENSTTILATLHTGKTHQLRLHFLSLNHPIIGDELYGEKTSDKILKLHSSFVEFIHPVTNEKISIYNEPKWLNN